mmetsp:Transcript_31835/g.73890  ORF Transcript_31835/g.73890 Transcript_31835/m.73890 type:complete len:157 (+) Transcript_31835:187-657(+)
MWRRRAKPRRSLDSEEGVWLALWRSRGWPCGCAGGKDLSTSISAAEEKMPLLGASIEELEGKLSQLKEQLKSAQGDREGAKDAEGKASAIREKEADAFAAERRTSRPTSPRSTRPRPRLRRDMLEADRQDLVAFLSSLQSNSYAPQSGQIIGILKQ